MKAKKSVKENVKAETPETVKKKVFVYFISFAWKHGKQEGFGCYEQPSLSRLDNINQLRDIAVNYSRHISGNVSQQRKSAKLWDKLRIPKGEISIQIIDFKLLREETQVVPVMAKPDQVVKTDKAGKPVPDNVQQMPVKTPRSDIN